MPVHLCFDTQQPETVGPMENLYTIPFVDVRANGLRQLVEDYPERARALIDASRHTLGLFSELVASFCHQAIECLVIG